MFSTTFIFIPLEVVLTEKLWFYLLLTFTLFLSQ